MNHRYLLEVNGQSRWVDGQWLQGQLWIHLNGETFIVESETKNFGQGKGGKAKSDIVAPMPGKVTKVLAQDGAKVAEGQVLIVMEAMKMEYSLKAEQAGTVQKVDCKVGDQVVLGKILVKVNPDVKPEASK
ncbi:MAG: biotin/lipoyl-binding protein [Bdellovibrionaceae bacterium]|nr:biotin/lipoyl-binding protein [Pseudobdellovibrionaceae bacterium]